MAFAICTAAVVQGGEFVRKGEVIDSSSDLVSRFPASFALASVGNVAGFASSYGVTADCQHFYGATTAAGSATLTATGAGFTVTDIGKTIVVQGAGASTTNLITTIKDVATGGGSCTLTTAATTARSGTARIWWGTDNTTAIRACVTAQIAEGGKGPYQLPAGQILVTGALVVDSVNSSLSAVFTWPCVYAAAGSTPPVYGFVGASTSHGVPTSIQVGVSPRSPTSVKAHQNGTIIVAASAASNTYNSVFCQPALNENETSIAYHIFKNLTIRVPAKPTGGPQLSALDLFGAGGCDVDDVVVDTGEDAPIAIQPTAANATGFQAPSVNNSQARVRVGKVSVSGFYSGLGMSEHFNGDDVAATYCNTGVRINQGNHLIHIKRLMTFNNLVNLGVGTGSTSNNASVLTVDTWAIERPGAALWYSGQIDVSDASNLLSAYINAYAVVTANYGPDFRDGLSITGGKYVIARRATGRLLAARWQPGYVSESFQGGTAGNAISTTNTGQQWGGSAGTFKTGGTGSVGFIYSTGDVYCEPQGGADGVRVAMVETNLYDRVVEAEISPSTTAFRTHSGIIICGVDTSNYLSLIVQRENTSVSKLLFQKTVAGSNTVFSNTDFGTLPVPAYPGNAVPLALKAIIVNGVVYCYFNGVLCYTQVLTSGEQTSILGSKSGIFTLRGTVNDDQGSRFRGFRVNPVTP